MVYHLFRCILSVALLLLLFVHVLYSLESLALCDFQQLSDRPIERRVCASNGDSATTLQWIGSDASQDTDCDGVCDSCDGFDSAERELYHWDGHID
jgi:hypothetical protein